MLGLVLFRLKTSPKQMEMKTQKELEKAKEHFYELRLLECYNILRRYFDRLPFKPEKEHGEYIGIFVRVLSEIGKKNELSFYLSELEKLEPKTICPFITYQLAVAYVNSEPPQLKQAVLLLERFIKAQPKGDLAAKAKMTLAYCYDSISKDLAAVKGLIFSISDFEDPSVGFLLETWKAKVFRDEGNFIEAEKILKNLLNDLTPERDWYAYFTAKIIFIGLYRDWEKMDLARQLLVETLNLAKEKPLRTVKRQLSTIQESFADQKTNMPLVVRVGKGRDAISYMNASLEIDNSKPFEKLTKLLLIQKKLTKDEIVQALFEREYQEDTDDPMIYYHVHGVKKVLKRLGVANPNLVKKGPYYEFNGEVQLVEEAV